MRQEQTAGKIHLKWQMSFAKACKPCRGTMVCKLNPLVNLVLRVYPISCIINLFLPPLFKSGVKFPRRVG